MKIRNYNDSDFPLFEKLLKDIGIYYEPLDQRDILKNKIEHDPESILVAEEQGRLIGTVFIIYDPWYSLIYHLGVHPDYRRQGLANNLMNEAEGQLKSRGINIASLFVKKGNQQIIDFYKKRGWFVFDQVLCLKKEL